MVLGTKIMKTMCIILSFLLAACCYASASKNIIDKASLFSYSFQIEEKNEQCFLIHDAHRKPLVPKPPCYFIRESDQKLKYFYLISWRFRYLFTAIYNLFSKLSIFSENKINKDSTIKYLYPFYDNYT